MEEVADLQSAKAQSSVRKKGKKISPADAVVDMLEASALDGGSWTKVGGAKDSERRKSKISQIQVGKKGKKSKRKHEQMSLNDVLFCERMIGKHGEDFEACFSLDLPIVHLLFL